MSSNAKPTGTAEGTDQSPPEAMGEERHRILVDWRGGGRVYDRGPSLGVRFERQAALTPDAIALSCDGVALSYAQLNARANQVAHFLRARGVQRETLVGLFLERGIDLLVGLLGIVKSGGAYLPMDLAYPSDRLAFMTKDAQAPLVLSSAAARDALETDGADVVLLDEEWSQIAAYPDTNPDAAADPDSLAYVIYTSGSTGRPKGCEVTHGNVIRLFESCAEQFQFSASDAWTLFHSHAFDFSVWEMWGAWLYGGRVVVVPQAVARAPEQFLELLERERVTFLNQTPSAFKALTVALAARERTPALSLRTVVFGGEVLEIEPLREWFVRYGAAAPAFVNGYGITETTVFVSFHTVQASDLGTASNAPIGRPMPDLSVYVLDEARRVCPVGTPGELYIGGPGVTRGYLRRPDLTEQRFVMWSPSPDAPLERLYKSGDLVQWLPNGDLAFLGRIDKQVKIRGFRIEIGEIESVIARHPNVSTSAVVVRRDKGGEPRLVAYVVPRSDALVVTELRTLLKQSLPGFMVPSAFVTLESLPITANGKLDHDALPAPETVRPEQRHPYAAAIGEMERACCQAFATVLQLDRVGRTDNFFDLGGDSRLAVEASEVLERALGMHVSAAALFTHATPAQLAASLANPVVSATAAQREARTSGSGPEPIAIIAMAARLPGANSTEAFWENLLAERDSLTRFGPDDLDISIPDSVRNDPAYVAARTVLENPADFDPAFFGLSQRDGEIMDPQQRMLLELTWESLERAGYAPDRTAAAGQRVGVFAGSYSAEYIQKHVLTHPEIVERVGAFAVMLATDKDYVATRIAHRLNLTGPAVSIHTACSTSLVTIVQAVDSLRAGRCTMAVAGAASMTYPPRSGYLYQEGAMLSRDGVTRSFSADATGTVFGDGGAVVVLKRLDDALADGDPIYAVIRGAALNNDGGEKASFTAPSAAGQAAVIAEAIAEAGVSPRDISYVEAHGTATPLGDPVEIVGLTTAFRSGPQGTQDTGFCRIGSAKSNVGHVVAASGAVGVLKTALALTHDIIPATLHFTAPNPLIDFANSPFKVNAVRSAWPRGAQPRLAGVSSFGVGGTNAHVILAEPPLREESTRVDGPQLLRVSARTAGSLARSAAALAARLRAEPTINLADVAFTLREGRAEFAHRLAIVASNAEQAAIALEEPRQVMRAAGEVPAQRPEVVFVFPGQGAQYAGMGAALYDAEPVFRSACDEVFAALHGELTVDLRACMFGDAAGALIDTAVTQPATFCMEYALAALWRSRGVEPALMIGHSIGEFVAAVVAGVMSVADASRLVARRGRLMSALPSGAMLAVRLAPDAVRPRLSPMLSIAAVNSPESCVVAGPHDEIDAFAASLERDEHVSRRLPTSHAFHSAMMDPMLEAFEREVQSVSLAAPRIPIMSTVFARELSAADATSPTYWARHAREMVDFASAVRVALQDGPRAFLEVGPRSGLMSLVRQQANARSRDARSAATISSVADQPSLERASLQLAVAQLWTLGIAADGPLPTGRRRLRLPTYSFDHVRCWLDALPAVSRPTDSTDPTPMISANGSRTNGSHAPTPAAVPVAAAAPAPVAADRRPTLLATLRTLVADVAGVDLDDADPSAPFVELGLDSLVLTQLAIAVKKRFTVNITFRQVMEQHRSLDALTAYLDATLPADPVAASAAATPSTVQGNAANAMAQPLAQSMAMPVAFADDASLSFAQQVVRTQLQLMAQQLALLGGGTGTMPEVAVPAAPIAPAASIAAPSPVVAATAVAAPAATPADNDANLAHSRYDVTKAFGAIARIHTRPTSELTNKQREALDAFMRRYTARTAASKAFTVSHRSHLADPRVVNGFRPQTKEICYQIVVNRSRGSRVWDLDGNEYVDALNGFGMNLFGWQPDFVNEAVKRQLDEGHEIGPQHPLAGEVAELICELTGFDRAGLCNTGSEAVMGAVRVARTVTGRSLIVSFSGSYHGIFDEVLMRGTKKLRSVPAAPGIMPEAGENVLVLDYGTPESLAIIRDRAQEIAAVLVEPVQSRRPDFQPREFLHDLRQITADNGAVLIFDEVITGFRAHPRGAQELFGVQADLASYGKVIGGGYPIGVIAGKREFMDALDGGGWQYGDDSMPTVGVTYFAGTFVRHPLALAACKAVLLHLKEQGPALQSRVTALTTQMVASMNAIARRLHAPVEVNQIASLWRISMTEEHPLQDLLWAMMRDRGVHILDNFPCFLTTAHSEADTALIVRAFEASLNEMQASGFFPPPPVTAAPVADASAPPVPNARLGRDRDGSPAWFIPDPERPGQYVKVTH